MSCSSASCLPKGVVDPGIVFLRQQGLVRQWVAKTYTELEAIVLDAFIAADRADIEALCNTDAPRDAVAMATAVGRTEEWRAAEWARTSNHKGVASGTSSALDYFEQRRLDLPDSVRPGPWGTTAAGASRKKAARWRKRWGGRFARLCPCEVVPPVVMRQKALQLSPLPKKKTYASPIAPPLRATSHFCNTSLPRQNNRPTPSNLSHW